MMCARSILAILSYAEIDISEATSARPAGSSLPCKSDACRPVIVEPFFPLRMKCRDELIPRIKAVLATEEIAR
jgi:hypothetical protein